MDELTRLVAQWHGTPRQQMENHHNLTTRMIADGEFWGFPAADVTKLKDEDDIITQYVMKCDDRTNCTLEDRTYRDEVLHKYVRVGVLDNWRPTLWAKCADKVITLSDLHLLRFFMANERAGRHEKAPANEVVAEVNVYITAMDTILVVVDNALNKTGNKTTHAKPDGVTHVLIVILDEHDNEITSKTVTKVHTHMALPTKYHGQMLMAKAAFLVHTDDEPRFGQPFSFTMPKSVEDLARLTKGQTPPDLPDDGE